MRSRSRWFSTSPAPYRVESDLHREERLVWEERRRSIGRPIATTLAREGCDDILTSSVPILENNPRMKGALAGVRSIR